MAYDQGSKIISFKFKFSQRSRAVSQSSLGRKVEVKADFQTSFQLARGRSNILKRAEGDTQFHRWKVCNKLFLGEEEDTGG